MIQLSLGWCCLIATWIIVWGADDRLRETALMAVVGLAASVLLGYLGFATYDDLNFMRHGRREERDK